MTASIHNSHGDGAQIIKSVLRSHRLHQDDFFGPCRMPHLVEARRDAARQLVAAGFPPTFAARLLKRNHTTVLYYLDRLPVSKALRYHGRKILRHLAPDTANVVTEFAKAEGVSVHMLMATWVVERATHEADSKARDAA